MLNQLLSRHRMPKFRRDTHLGSSGLWVGGSYPVRLAEFTLAMVAEETPEATSGPKH